MDQLYHTKCFTCHHCAINLQGKPFYALDGNPYCEEDYLVRNITNLIEIEIILLHLLWLKHFWDSRTLWKNVAFVRIQFWIESWEQQENLTIQNVFVALFAVKVLMAFRLLWMQLIRFIALKISISKCFWYYLWFFTYILRNFQNICS